MESEKVQVSWRNIIKLLLPLIALVLIILAIVSPTLFYLVSSIVFSNPLFYVPLLILGLVALVWFEKDSPKPFKQVNKVVTVIIIIFAILLVLFMFAWSFDGGCPYNSWIHDTLRGCLPRPLPGY